MNQFPGKLIVLYGINNLGKSTQARLLVEQLKAQGFKAEYLKYPIYELEPSGRMLNDYLRNSNPHRLHSKEAQIIYAMNRVQYQPELLAKLSAGINIIAEDYKGTGIAWGLGAGVEENFLKDINSCLIDEDLVFIFDGERFKESIEEGHKHETNNDLINKVRWAHLKLREEYGWIKIDANLKIEEIRGIIWDRVMSFLNNSKDETQEEQVKTVKHVETELKTPAQSRPSGFRTFGDIMKQQEMYKNAVKNKSAENMGIEKVEAVQKVNLLYHEEPVYKIQPIIKTPEIKTEIKTETKEEVEVRPDIQSEIKNNIKNEIKTARLRDSAKLPSKAHLSDAGFDLYADNYYSIMPYGQALVGTGIKMAIPDGYVGLIWDKSGLANLGITTMGGVIDSAYRGEIKVIVKNLSEDIFNISPGQKIAQIIIQEAPHFNIVEANIDNNSERGERGFGSSGRF